MAKSVIVAGHICIDITPIFPQKTAIESVGRFLEPGKLLHVERADVHTGGCVANTGLAMKKLGANVRLLGKIGKDPMGAMIRDAMRQDEADRDLITDNEAATSYSVVLALPGLDRIFLHHPGANDTFSEKDISDALLQNAALFHFGYPPLMQQMFAENGKELEALMRRAKQAGAATSLDMAAVDPESQAGQADWKSILKNVLPWVDFFVPSFEELCFMLDREKYDRLAQAANGDEMIQLIDWERDVRPLAAHAMALGCRVILIKCGSKGLYYRTAGQADMKELVDLLGLSLPDWASLEGTQGCFVPQKIASGTGAGDTSIAAFLTAVLRGKTAVESVRLAAAEGACCVTTYDALSGLCTLEELEQRVANGWDYAKGDTKCWSI